MNRDSIVEETGNRGTVTFERTLNGHRPMDPLPDWSVLFAPGKDPGQP